MNREQTSIPANAHEVFAMRHMRARQPRGPVLRLRLMLLAACLLLAQLFTVLHAIAHELEQGQGRVHDTCLLCHAADHLGTALAAAELLIRTPPYTSAQTHYRRSHVATIIAACYRARAPPVIPLAEIT